MIYFYKVSHKDGNNIYDTYYDFYNELSPKGSKRGVVGAILKKYVGVDGSISRMLHYKDMVKIANDRGIYFQIEE